MMKLPYYFKLQSRSARDFSHQHAHYISGIKKQWRYTASHLHCLFTIASKMTMDTDIDLDPKWALLYCG